MTTISTTTEAVVNNHLQRFFEGDLQGVVSDYAPDAVLIVPTGVLRGVDGIRPLFEALIAEFAKPGATFDLQQQVVDDHFAFIRWGAETAGKPAHLGPGTLGQQSGT